MTRATKPLTILVYQDVLCAWCYIAELRLESVRRELGPLVRFKRRPYPLRPTDGAPTAKEISAARAELMRARLEPEGKRLSEELWTGGDLPGSSVAALAALEAARLQGPEVARALSRVLQRAALEEGINVTRTDAVFELASGLGLQMNRFAAAFQSPETRNLILEEYRLASVRGVRRVPTLVIGGRWMMSGLREVAEYREQILTCMGKEAQTAFPLRDRVVH